MAKKRCLPLTALVILNVPVPLKVLVATGVHEASGSATFVVATSTYVPPAGPFVPPRIRFPLERRTLLMTGLVGATTTTRFKLPFVGEREPVVPGANPAPDQW